MKATKIEKRTPFGFLGEWAKLYKLYNFEEKIDKETVKWKKNTYADLGMDLQVKYLEDGIDKQRDPVQNVRNRVSKGDYRIVQTTDAYFDEDSRTFECVVDLGDIINAFGRWWVVDSIEEKSIFTPKKQSFYYIALKRIQEEVIIEGE